MFNTMTLPVPRLMATMPDHQHPQGNGAEKQDLTYQASSLNQLHRVEVMCSIKSSIEQHILAVFLSIFHMSTNYASLAYANS